MRDERVHWIEKPAQIRTLAQPLRQEIIDTVQLHGRCAVSDLARELGRPIDGLYYHVRALCKVGLLTEAGTRLRTRRQEKLYATPSPDQAMRLRYDPTDRRSKPAVVSVVQSMLRIAEREFRNGFQRDLAVCDGALRNLWAAHSKGWLTDRELAEVNRLLSRLTGLMNRPKTRARRHFLSLSFVIAPIEPKPMRRGRKQTAPDR